MSEPTPVLVIDDLSLLKVLADPLRQRLLNAFAGEPRTTKQVADALNLPPTRLYRHVEMLEQAGFLTLVRTAPKRGTVEKYYQVSARKITVAPESLGQGQASALEEMFENAFREALEGVRLIAAEKASDPQETKQSAILATGIVNLSPKQLEEFQAKVDEICNEFSKETEGPAKTFRMILALCPSSGKEEQRG